MNIDISLADLARFSDYIQQVVLLTKPAIVHGLNDFGEKVLESFVKDVETQTGLDPYAIRQSITVYQADTSNLQWTMEATQLVPSSNFQPDMESFVGGPGVFNAEMLLMIVSGYADPCPICVAAIANNPHSAEEINELAAEWANYTPPYAVEGYRTNLLHPNCRCRAKPFGDDKREFIVRGPVQGETITAQGLAAVIGNELTITVKDIGK